MDYSTLSLEVGMVVDAFASIGCCLVQRQGAPALISASVSIGDGYQTGMTTWQVPSPGTVVLLYVYDDNRAYIVGSLPYPLDDYYNNTSLWVGLPDTGVDFRTNSVHSLSDEQIYQLGLDMYTPTAAKDLLPGDYDIRSGFGAGLFIGRMTTALTADPMTGIYVSQLGHNVRITGGDISIMAPGNWLRYYEDEGEAAVINISTPYPWEMYGVSGINDASFSISDMENPWPTSIGDQFISPIDPKMLPVARDVEYGGFLGDIDRRILCAPLDEGVNTPDNQISMIGLSEIARYIDGAIAIRSRAGLLFEKSTYISVPTQIYEHDDPRGDTISGDSPYKAAGRYGNGPEHERTPYTLATDDENADLLQTQLRSLDKWAYAVDARANTSFRAHKLDWAVVSEADDENFTGPITQDVFNGPGRNATASIPESEDIQIDHRKDNTVRIFKGRAAITIEDDGSILLEDAWGSQIAMSGGNIDITCAGDVNIRPGRSLNVIAGADSNIRSAGCVDISAGHGDVRIKAERNLHTLSGNSGEGGTLIESRGRTKTPENDYSRPGTETITNGVTIIAANARTNIYGRGVYVEGVNNGDITFDASGGNSNIFMYANELQRGLQTGQFTAYGAVVGEGQEPDTYDIATASLAVLGQRQVVLSDGQLLVADDIIGSQEVIGIGGIIGDNKGVATGSAQAQVSSAIATALTTAEDTAGTVVADAAADGRPYNDAEPYGEYWSTSIGFTFRESEQHPIDEFYMQQSRWQQLSRMLGIEGPVFSEPAVTSKDGSYVTLPYPGNKFWNDQTFITADPVYFDPSKGIKSDSTEISATQLEIPASAYTVSLDNGGLR